MGDNQNEQLKYEASQHSFMLLQQAAGLFEAAVRKSQAMWIELSKDVIDPQKVMDLERLAISDGLECQTLLILLLKVQLEDRDNDKSQSLIILSLYSMLLRDVFCIYDTADEFQDEAFAIWCETHKDEINEIQNSDELNKNQLFNNIGDDGDMSHAISEFVLQSAQLGRKYTQSSNINMISNSDSDKEQKDTDQFMNTGLKLEKINSQISYDIGSITEREYQLEMEKDKKFFNKSLSFLNGKQNDFNLIDDYEYDQVGQEESLYYSDIEGLIEEDNTNKQGGNDDNDNNEVDDEEEQEEQKEVGDDENEEQQYSEVNSITVIDTSDEQVGLQETLNTQRSQDSEFELDLNQQITSNDTYDLFNGEELAFPDEISLLNDEEMKTLHQLQMYKGISGINLFGQQYQTCFSEQYRKNQLEEKKQLYELQKQRKKMERKRKIQKMNKKLEAIQKKRQIIQVNRYKKYLSQEKSLHQYNSSFNLLNQQKTFSEDQEDDQNKEQKQEESIQLDDLFLEDDSEESNKDDQQIEENKLDSLRNRRKGIGILLRNEQNYWKRYSTKLWRIIVTILIIISIIPMIILFLISNSITQQGLVVCQSLFDMGEALIHLQTLTVSATDIVIISRYGAHRNTYRKLQQYFYTNEFDQYEINFDNLDDDIISELIYEGYLSNDNVSTFINTVSNDIDFVGNVVDDYQLMANALQGLNQLISDFQRTVNAKIQAWSDDMFLEVRSITAAAEGMITNELMKPDEKEETRGYLMLNAPFSVTEALKSTSSKFILKLESQIIYDQTISIVLLVVIHVSVAIGALIISYTASLKTIRERQNVILALCQTSKQDAHYHIQQLQNLIEGQQCSIYEAKQEIEKDDADDVVSEVEDEEEIHVLQEDIDRELDMLHVEQDKFKLPLIPLNSSDQGFSRNSSLFSIQDVSSSQSNSNENSMKSQSTSKTNLLASQKNQINRQYNGQQLWSNKQDNIIIEVDENVNNDSINNNGIYQSMENIPRLTQKPIITAPFNINYVNNNQIIQNPHESIQQRNFVSEEDSSDLKERVKRVRNIIPLRFYYCQIIGTSLIICGLCISYTTQLLLLLELQGDSSTFLVAGIRGAEVVRFASLAQQIVYLVPEKNITNQEIEQLNSTQSNEKKIKNNEQVDSFNKTRDFIKIFINESVILPYSTNPISYDPQVLSANKSILMDVAIRDTFYIFEIQKLLLYGSYQYLHTTMHDGREEYIKQSVVTGDSVLDNLNVHRLKGKYKALDQFSEEPNDCFLQDQSQCFEGRIAGTYSSFVGLDNLVDIMIFSAMRFVGSVRRDVEQINNQGQINLTVNTASSQANANPSSLEFGIIYCLAMLDGHDGLINFLEILRDVTQSDVNQRQKITLFVFIIWIVLTSAMPVLFFLPAGNIVMHQQIYTQMMKQHIKQNQEQEEQNQVNKQTNIGQEKIEIIQTNKSQSKNAKENLEEQKVLNQETSSSVLTSITKANSQDIFEDDQLQRQLHAKIKKQKKTYKQLLKDQRNKYKELLRLSVEEQLQLESEQRQKLELFTLQQQHLNQIFKLQCTQIAEEKELNNLYYYKHNMNRLEDVQCEDNSNYKSFNLNAMDRSFELLTHSLNSLIYEFQDAENNTVMTEIESNQKERLLFYIEELLRSSGLFFTVEEIILLETNRYLVSQSNQHIKLQFYKYFREEQIKIHKNAHIDMLLYLCRFHYRVQQAQKILGPDDIIPGFNNFDFVAETTVLKRWSETVIGQHKCKLLQSLNQLHTEYKDQCDIFFTDLQNYLPPDYANSAVPPSVADFLMDQNSHEDDLEELQLLADISGVSFINTKSQKR